jgi:heme/copper-type cytochrome/quinol oxidase subunit 3
VQQLDHGASVRAAQLGQRKAIVLFLILTLVLGGVFLGVKAFEWKEKFDEHHIPGPSFHIEGVSPDQQGHAQLFFSLYFAMTGLHALHMVIGAGLLLYLILRGAQRIIFRRVQHAGRPHRSLLALRRYHLDFPVPTLVFD